jgi:hypothetical protein
MNHTNSNRKKQNISVKVNKKQKFDLLQKFVNDD